MIIFVIVQISGPLFYSSLKCTPLPVFCKKWPLRLFIKYYEILKSANLLRKVVSGTIMPFISICDPASVVIVSNGVSAPQILEPPLYSKIFSAPLVGKKIATLLDFYETQQFSHLSESLLQILHKSWILDQLQAQTFYVFILKTTKGARTTPTKMKLDRLYT